MVAKLAKIGIVPGQDFDASKLDPAVANRTSRTRPPSATSSGKTHEPHGGPSEQLSRG